MKVILEGPDNAGKSTLAKAIGDKFNWPIIGSEGREKYPGEINERIKRYMDLHQNNVIYDRHPCVSQEIYRVLHGKSAVETDLIKQFYESEPLFIYCRPAVGRGMKGHIARDDDSPEYLQMLEKKYGDLLRLYDAWALNHAQVVYRIEDNSLDMIIDFIRGAVS